MCAAAKTDDCTVTMPQSVGCYNESAFVKSAVPALGYKPFKGCKLQSLSVHLSHPIMAVLLLLLSLYRH